MHDHALDRYQAVVKSGTGIVVWPTGSDQVDRLPAGRARADPLEEMPRHAIVEIGMGQEQMLIQPAPHQRFSRTGAVEQFFPLGNLRRLAGRGLDCMLIDGGALPQPGLYGVVLLVCQPGDGQGHALFGVALGVGIELARRRADVFAVQAQHDFFGQLGVGGQRRAVPQLQHARHQGRLRTLGVEHRVKAFVTPLVRAAGIVKNPRRRDGIDAVALVHRHFACPPGGALRAPQVQLTGRVVTGVAGNAFFSKDRLDIPSVGNKRANQRGLCQRGTAHHQRHGAGEEAKKHVPLS